MSYPQHPLSAAFPAMSMLEQADLASDIQAHGLRSPIVLFDDQVLDGWHRYRACLSSGAAPRFVQFPEGEDPVAFVRSQNYHRRHLSGSQKSVAETELAKWAPSGRPKNTQPGCGIPSPKPPTELEVSTEKEMATAAGVSIETIRQAKRAVEAGLGDAVKAGEVSVKRAAEIAKLPEPERQAAIHAPRPKPVPAPAPKPGPEGTDVEALHARIRRLEAEVELKQQAIDNLKEDLLQTAEMLKESEEENQSMGRVVDADDQVKAAMAEAKRFRELARVVEERNRGLQNQNHALSGEAKRWMNKFLRLEKKAKGDLATDETFQVGA